jgi:glycosyltransferase involved in cell wall biosynthesis
MKEKLSKLVNVYKKYGFIGFCKKLRAYMIANYLDKISIKVFLNKRKYRTQLRDILTNNKYDRIVLWRSSFGYNVELFQRPQHIANNLAKNKCLVFYEVTTMTDKVKTIAKQANNLYLINFNNIAMKNLLFNELKNINKPKYIQFYSTDATINLNTLKGYINDGYKILYEYIDDLSPLLVGTSELPINIKEKYEYMLKDTQNVFVVVTADEIQKDVVSKRGNEKLVFSCNGVDYEHFNNFDNEFKFDKKFQNILDDKKPIIGYYGALASWFDYDMIKKLAKEKPGYNIVLFGIKYDDSFDKANLDEYSNIYFLGSKEYNVLQNYASKFDVCTIPFLINDITQATSPLKLFEYMALGKPIVTTAMKECKKYESVMIANNQEEFIKLIDKSIELTKNKNDSYFRLLNKEALENTWEAKAHLIIELLKKYE